VEFCVRKIYRRVSENGKIRKKKKIQHREHREKTHRVSQSKGFNAEESRDAEIAEQTKSAGKFNG